MEEKPDKPEILWLKTIYGTKTLQEQPVTRLEMVFNELIIKIRNKYFIYTMYEYLTCLIFFGIMNNLTQCTFI